MGDSSSSKQLRLGQTWIFALWADFFFFFFRKVSLRSDGHKLMKLYGIFSLLEMMLVSKSLTLSVFQLYI